MNNNKEQLMKHFASVLRGRALGKLETPSIDLNIARYFKRVELIEIISKRFNGTIPKEHNLVELENEELLNLIGDEMYIISYMTEKWCNESSHEKIKKLIAKERVNTQKQKGHAKKDTKTS